MSSVVTWLPKENALAHGFERVTHWGLDAGKVQLAPDGENTPLRTLR